MSEIDCAVCGRTVPEEDAIQVATPRSHDEPAGLEFVCRACDPAEREARRQAALDARYEQLISEARDHGWPTGGRI